MYRDRFLKYPTVFAALDRVQTAAGVTASDDHWFKGAVFGRDSLIVGLDLVDILPALARRIIFSLARLQGQRSDRSTEEDAGKIHHEHRTLELGGELIGTEQRQIMEELSAKWGGTAEELTYYGSVDATPQFIRLVAAHPDREEILQTEFQRRDGSIATIEYAVRMACSWIMQELRLSSIGLLEFRRRNPKGLHFQVMRDGRVSYIHEDGTLADYGQPIASLEVQALAYDALMATAEMLDDLDLAAQLRSAALELRNTTLNQFWIKEENRFAMALDRDREGYVRDVRTASSVAAELLDTTFFDRLAEVEKDRYIGAIVREMFSDEFLTDVGIRMVAKRYIGLIPYIAYQLGEACWPVTASCFARGLRRQGLEVLAEDIEDRFLRGVCRSGSFEELWYVDQHGEVVYRGIASDRGIRATAKPEGDQAWTISAVLRAMVAQETPPREALPGWRRELQRDICLKRLSPTHPLDLEAGRAAERAFAPELADD